MTDTRRPYLGLNLPPAPKKAKPIALVQWAALTTEQKAELADRLFMLAEYGTTKDISDSDSVGYDMGSDFVQDLTGLFTEYGVTNLTSPDNRPDGYRYTKHLRADGTTCPYSLLAVREPRERHQPGNIRCPYQCPASAIETDPDASRDTAERVNVDVIVRHLSIAGIRQDVIETSAGEWMVYIGAGAWDEAAERYTHPVSLGPCYRERGLLVGFPGDTSYGRTDDVFGRTVELDPGTCDEESVAAEIVALYRSIVTV